MAELPRAVRPLRHPAYRRLAATLVASVLAEGLWTLAVVWQVVELGGGPPQLSVVVGALAVGLVATALLGGVLADRLPQRRILVGLQSVQAASIGVVAGLSWAGWLTITVLVVQAAVVGVSLGLFFPAYSALVPALVDADDLLAVNGLEGAVRPVVLTGAGPALAGLLVAVFSPAAAIAATAVACAASLAAAWSLPRLPAHRAPGDEEAGRAVRGAWRDLVDGFRYMLATRWLLVTVVFASLMILVVLGPIEVLVPFAIIERADGGPGDHSLVLLAHGVGGAASSLLVASMRLPRRYLTAMIAAWSLGCLPMAVFGLATSLWPMVLAGFALGALFSAPQVVWGTLLQRRVPRHLLGRVSSLDFFVSLGLMPVSMALAGPVSVAVGLTPVFLVAGLVPLAIGAVALLLGRLGPDEIAHPLDEPVLVERVGAGPDGQATGCERS